MASINLGRVQGYSAYEIAVQNGYSGTELEWLASLKGADGEDGTNGTDGVSPEASVERNQADTGAVITITDATGTTTATVYDGETPSLTGYATETYVDNAVGAIDVPTATSDLTNDSGFITSSDLSGYAQTSSLATVATSGDYDDLINKPTIPDVSGLATETYVDNAVAGITVPTATSDLTNDSDFITMSDVEERDYARSGDLAAVAFDGSYNSLTDTPTIPAAPSIATTQTAGLVKPDGTTITIDANGTISSASSGGLSPDSRNNFVLPNSSNSAREDNSVQRNIIMGYSNGTGYQNSANNAIFGLSNVSYGSNNLIAGASNTAAWNDNNYTYSSYSGLIGYHNSAKGDNSLLAGYYLLGEADNQAIFGKYNSDRTSPLVVGIGTGNAARADAFKVTSAGNGVFAGTVQATDFLDSNGDSIIGSGGDSLPTINSGDAGKALVVNSGETGVEWATVGGGSAPVDPAHSSKNVYTGDGYWNNAWDTAMSAAFSELVYDTQVSRERDSFTFTAGEYDDWGAEQLHLVIGLLDTVNVEDTIWEGTMFQNGEDYTDENGFWELSRVSSNDEYAYTLTSLNSDYSNMNVLNQFTLSHDNFMQTLVELGVPIKTTEISGSDYIEVSYTSTPEANQYIIEPVIYPATRHEESMDTSAIVNDVTPIAVTGGGTEWAITNQDLSDPVWTNWFAASGRVMKLWGNGEIFREIYIDDSETTNPYHGVSGETVSIIKNNTTLTIIIPDMDSATAPTLSTIDLYHSDETLYGLVDYNYIQNEVIRRPLEFPIGHTDTTDPNTYHNTEWQSNRLYFIDTARDEVLGGGYEDVDVITSSIGTDGMSIEYDSKRDSIKDKATYTQSGISFNHIEYTDDGRGNVTYDVNETLIWTPENIQLKDQTTGDIYQLSIDNGQIVLTNVSM